MQNEINMIMKDTSLNQNLLLLETLGLIALIRYRFPGLSLIFLASTQVSPKIYFFTHSKTIEILWFFYAFKGYRKETLAWNGVMETLI